MTTRTAKILPFLIGIVAAGGLSASGIASAGFKCWTNSEGVRECGNTVPPEYSQKKTETVNDHGVTVDVRERAKTRAELEAERKRLAAERARLAAEQERQRQQEASDRVLLATFVTEQDIVQARDRKLAAISGTVEVSRASIGKLEEKLGDYQRRAGNLERNGRPVPDDLKADMATVKAQIANKEEYITAQQAEMERLRRKYQQDIIRFRELMSQGRVP